MFKHKKGQSTLEYALIIAVVVAGLLLMQHYVRRGYAGRLRTSTDDMGEQYDPIEHSGNFQTNQYSFVRQTVQSRETATTHCAIQWSNRMGDEHVNAYNWSGDPHTGW